MEEFMTRGQTAPLSSNEEVTLRRVAFGQSAVWAMRAEDLAHLRQLELIDDGKDGPQLTASGRLRFEGLPKALTLVDRGPDPLRAALDKWRMPFPRQAGEPPGRGSSDKRNAGKTAGKPQTPQPS